MSEPYDKRSGAEVKVMERAIADDPPMSAKNLGGDVEEAQRSSRTEQTGGSEPNRRKLTPACRAETAGRIF